ncbi:MAG TPA: hypothetical protein VLF60_00260 [Candidatus Saccharimonadales bacterium]|nr:hypothetical protein [Candidatus Saccharimonadales bacterium]
MPAIPHLDHYDDFARALQNYQLSSEALQILAQTPLTLMVGPTSVGRDTIISELVKTGAYYDIVTSTTRPPRVNNGLLEQDGVEYHFQTEAHMLEETRAGRLVGPAIIHEQQVSGISIQEFQKALALKKIAITDTDPVGAIDITQLKPDALAIFVLPPSFTAWIDRISNRGAPSKQELQRRLTGAIKEFTLALEHDCFVFMINDELAEAVKEADALAHGTHQPQHERFGRELAARLREETKAYLETL